MPDLDLTQYYTPEEAAAILSKNSGRKVTPNYIRVLVARGKISHETINKRFSVYPRSEIDKYIVKAPGVKSGEASRKRKEAKLETNQTAK